MQYLWYVKYVDIKRFIVLSKALLRLENMDRDPLRDLSSAYAFFYKTVVSICKNSSLITLYLLFTCDVVVCVASSRYKAIATGVSLKGPQQKCTLYF
jgi:hypothetical protein